MKTKVLMVCLGNICRSPLAEGIFQSLLIKNKLEHSIEVDSAGTSSFHIGKTPDLRSITIAKDNGIILNHRARQILDEDFVLFDHILVMDKSNLINASEICSQKIYETKIQLITKFDTRLNSPLEVIDPYWGSSKDFEQIFDQLHHCCDGWIKKYLEAHSNK
ncbi:MAG: low molecular weight protein-tyrosine-phosphatase [Bacteriovoracaceae bacterium]